MSFTRTLGDLIKSTGLSHFQASLLLQAHELDVERQRDDLTDELKQHQEEIHSLKSANGRLKYKAARLAVNTLLDFVAWNIRQIHDDARSEACRNINTESTSQILLHLVDCEMIPVQLRNAIDRMQGLTAADFDRFLARTLFAKQSCNIRLTPFIEPDMAIIPYNIPRFQKHLVIVIAKSLQGNFQYVDEDGVDVTDVIEPGLRNKVNTVWPKMEWN